MISKEALPMVHLVVKHREGVGVEVQVIEAADQLKRPRIQATTSTYPVSATKLTLENLRLLLPKLAEFKKQASSPTLTPENPVCSDS
jgi:hypothetical protein